MASFDASYRLKKIGTRRGLGLAVKTEGGVIVKLVV